MANYYLIQLSVYPFIRKYLLHHYSEPLIITKRGHIPSFINNVLAHMPKMDPADIKKSEKIPFGDFFGFAITEGTVKSNGCHIISSNVKKINEVISDIIHEELYRMITSKAGGFINVDQRIREFQAIYNFSEDELPFDNLKRWYYRERQAREERLKKIRDIAPKFILTLSEEIKADDCIVKKIAS